MTDRISDDELDKDDRHYIEGMKAAYKSMLSECISHLGAEDKDKYAWQLERAATVAALRSLCEDIGDNDWEDNLHLADVISKHIVPYIEDE
jgi:predicted secreted protein